MAKKSKKGLGRGLSSLISELPSEKKAEATPAPKHPPPPAKPVASAEAAAPAAPATSAPSPSAEGTPASIPVGDIRANPFQPRREFDPDALAELAESIREHGILQPLSVRKTKNGLELIAGERRFRAAQSIGLTEVPVVFVEADDRTSLELALIENLQREDLGPLEEAEGYQRLAEQFKYTQEQIAKRVGKARATITNSLRLLGLTDHCKTLLNNRKISAGHARAILALDIAAEQNSVADRVMLENLSVRKTEQLVNHLRGGTKPKPEAVPDLPDHYVADVENRLHEKFKTRINLVPTRSRADGKKTTGKVHIEFYSNEDLNRILGLLGIDLTDLG